LFYRFLDDTSSRFDFKEKMKQFREGIIYIQREIRKTKIMYMAKFETLKKMWIL